MSKVRDKTIREDRVSMTVRVKAPTGPLNDKAGEQIAKGKARREAMELIPFGKQTIESIRKVKDATGPRAYYDVVIKHQNPRGRVGERELFPKEQQLWDKFRNEQMGRKEGEWISVTQMAKQMGIHEEKARQIVRTWDNEGLVKAKRNHNHAKITDKGKRTHVLPPR